MAVVSIEEVVLLMYSSDVSIIERKIFTVVSLNISIITMFTRRPGVLQKRLLQALNN